MNSAFIQQPWAFVCMAVIATAAVATPLPAAAETITIIGEPTGWCSGPGQEIVDQIDLDTCQCTQGWELIEDENADGEPLCGLIVDSGDTGPDNPDEEEPPTGGGATPPPEPKPTTAQCEALHNECLRNASALTDNCRSDSMRFFNGQLANGFACHDQSLDDLVAGFDYRVLGIRVSCDASDFRDIDDPAKDNCRIQAIKRGRDRCQFGVKQTSTTQGVSESYAATFTTPVWEIGGTSTSETSLTVEGRGGMGSDQMCMGMGLKATAQCASLLTACTSEASDAGTPTEMIVVPLHESATPSDTVNTAGGSAATPSGTGGGLNFEVQIAQPSPTGPPNDASGPGGPSDTASLAVSPQTGAPVADTMAPPDLHNLLKDRIDRARLGFSDGTSLAGDQTFRPIPQGDLEYGELYIERLRFLANWSSFLRAHDIEGSRQHAMEDAFANIQSDVDARRHRHAQILWSLWAVDMKTGEIGSNGAREIWDAFQREGGLWREMRAGDALIRTRVADALGPDLEMLFFENVWPGIVLFAFASPMADGPPVVVIEN